MHVTDFTEEKIYHYFQPIYGLKNLKRWGYEALLRPNPENFFREAKKAKQLFELDSRSIYKALATYQSAGLSRKDGNLFLNILPSTVSHPNFLYFLEQIIESHYLESQQIVLEISETECIDDFDTFKYRIGQLKNVGFLIALDDFGSGNSDFRSMIELEPNYLKLDRYFAQNLNESKQKQSIIRLFLHYCKQYHCQLILEGVETPAEMAMAKELDVTAVQGYIFGRPGLLKVSV